ncbi:MAG: DUF4446 family protein [Candidatus Levybacteria bacterium]|nr:DUF4446 family protein [Candidatus Levybacteria bacterium]
MVFSFELVGLLIGVIWLIVLTILFLKISSHYNNLTKEAEGSSLISILNELLKESKLVQKDIENLKSQYDKMEKDGLLHIQKIGLLRFNPFKDTGGDQSFILSLIDANNTGVVISGLYSRSGTRWYAKRVISGRGVEHELSDEEKQAVKEAKNHK